MIPLSIPKKLCLRRIWGIELNGDTLVVGQMIVRGPRNSIISPGQLEAVVHVVTVARKVGVKSTHFFVCLVTGQHCSCRNG